MNIYVGNVPYAATETDLEELFQEYGRVATATIIRDWYDGRSKGFGFVEMENQEDGERAIEALDGQEMMGRPLKVNKARPREQRREPRRKDNGQKQSDRSSETTSPNTGSSPDGGFHNPYTFVPSPPRDQITAGEFAGDFNPLEKGLDHASLKDDLWTGYIPIKLTTVTPLVLLKDDGREREPKEPQTYDVHDCIPESSLRGMLRSAYEVATNSRYGGFSRDHKEKLACRMDTTEAPKLIPAIIKNGNTPGKLVARLCTGTSVPTSEGPKKNGTYQERAMYAAMFDPYYDPELYTEYDAKYTPKTGHEVWAQIVLCQHRRNNKVNYRYWKALKVWWTGQYPNRPTESELVEIPSTEEWTSLYTNIEAPIELIVKGHIFITNENIKGKHDERIFFYHNQNKQIEKEITDSHEKAWQKLIKNYRDAHNDIFDRPGALDEPWKKIGNDPGETAWSPHLYQDSEHQSVWHKDPHGRATTHDAIKLQDGDMVYARCEFDQNDRVSKIKDIFPVMISRELYENSPEDLLDASLRPAKVLDELSPADRLFGWVPQQKQDSNQDSQSYKGRIRVVCNDGPGSGPVKRFDGDGIPLAILGQPKPAQGRFYVAKDKNGTPQDDRISKSKAGYNKASKKGLRGRKHYWHHRGREVENAPNYWNPFVENQNQEYLRADGKRDSQNRSITGWIEPNTKFKASLYLQNLEPAEVGALLWLLSLPEDHYFKLGYGKPLGFGSVRMQIDQNQLVNNCLPLGTGKDWKKYYADLNESSPAKLSNDRQNECIQAFKTNMKTAFNKSSFEQLRFISDFLQVLKGPVGDAPIHIHYPRPKRSRDPKGKNFEWFVANENRRSQRVLPKVKDKDGLPYQR